MSSDAMVTSSFGKTPGPPSSVAPTEDLLQILGEYVSSINARSLLARSANRSDNSLTGLTAEELSRVVARVEAGAVLFTRPERRAELQSKLAEFLRRHKPSQVESELIQIRAEGDIVVARTRARAMCLAVGARSVGAHKVATVVSELARNIVSYTPGGTIELSADGSKRSFTIRARDTGSGIPNLDAILGGRYQSRTGLGLGIAGSRKLADSFDIKTGPTGTTITLTIAL